MTLAKALQVAAGNSQESADVAEAIDFDGTNDYLSRASDLVGNTDSKTFTFSAWFWYDGTATGYIYREFVSGQGYFHCRVESSGKIAFAGANTAGTGIFLAEYDLAALPPFKNTFYHILVSVDLANTANRYWYVNDQLVSPAWTTYSNQNIDFTTAAHAVGANVDGSLKFDGRLSNVFLDYTYRNLSVEANRRLFVTADLKPAAGQAALNPILYLPMNDPTAPGANAGTGGNFTLTGTVARSGRGPNQYNAPYSDFDGSADYLSRTSLSGIAAGKQFTVSANFSLDNTAASNAILWMEDVSMGTILQLWYSSSGKIVLRAAQTNGSSSIGTVLNLDFIYSFVANRNYQLTISIDLTNTSNRHVYLNGENASAYLTWLTYSSASNIGFDWVDSYRVGASPSGTYLNGRLGALWFNTSYIDLSVAANLAKFVTGTGIDAKPVDLGASGELPTGTSPLIYLPMYGNNAGKNYGTGGDFTVNSGPYTGARGPNEFWGNRADFSGNLNRTTELVGAVDSATLSMSFFINMPSFSSPSYWVFNLQDAVYGQQGAIYFNSTTQMTIYFQAPNGTVRVSATLTHGMTTNTNNCVQIFLDTTDTAKRGVYINGAAKTVTWSTYTSGTIGVLSDKVYIGSRYNNTGYLYGKLSEFYLTTEYIDFSQEANRLKFRDAFGNPVNLTQQIEDAAIPNPAIYMRFPPTSFGTNYGTGGNFTVNGTITDGGNL